MAFAINLSLDIFTLQYIPAEPDKQTNKSETNFTSYKIFKYRVLAKVAPSVSLISNEHLGSP